MSIETIYTEYTDKDNVKVHLNFSKEYRQIEFTLLESIDDRNPKEGRYKITEKTNSSSKDFGRFTFSKNSQKYNKDEPLELFRKTAIEFLKKKRVKNSK